MFSNTLSDEAIEAILTNTQFTAIESGDDSFRPFLQSMCGLTISGTIECSHKEDQLEPSGLPTPPGLSGNDGQDLASIDLRLTGQRYTDNYFEIFWPKLPQRFGLDQIEIEVYRNDLLVDTTKANTSWRDNIDQTENPVRYKVRAIDMRGNVGVFSDAISIDINTGLVEYNDGTVGYEFIQTKHRVENIELVKVGGTTFVSWSGSTPGVDGLKGYEVRVNNKPVSFNDGFMARLSTFDDYVCNIISVAAISDENTIFDYATTSNTYQGDGKTGKCDGRRYISVSSGS